MMTIYHFFERIASRRLTTATLGTLFLATNLTFAQGDRSERLQERVTTSNARVDITRNNTPPPINSMAQQALRKAQNQVERAKAQLAQANASLAETRKRGQNREADQFVAQAETRVRTAAAEVEKACKHLSEAQNAAQLERQR